MAINIVAVTNRALGRQRNAPAMIAAINSNIADAGEFKFQVIQFQTSCCPVAFAVQGRRHMPALSYDAPRANASAVTASTSNSGRCALLLARNLTRRRNTPLLTVGLGGGGTAINEVAALLLQAEEASTTLPPGLNFLPLEILYWSQLMH